MTDIDESHGNREVLRALAARVDMALSQLAHGNVAAAEETLARLARVLPKPHARHVAAAHRDIRNA